MSRRKSDVQRLEYLLDSVAESILNASEEELQTMFREAGKDTSLLVEQTQSLIASKIRKHNQQRLKTAREGYDSIRRLFSADTSTRNAGDQATWRSVLDNFVGSRPNMPSTLTLAYRELAKSSDNDIAGLLDDLSVLNGGDDRDGTSLVFRYRSVDNLFTELGIAEPRDIDIEAIAYYCGAVVKYRELESCVARIVGLNNRAVISVGSTSTRGRQRFSIAHELGHWMLDRGKTAHSCNETDLSTPWESRQDPESRANEFAAELLMPKFMFKSIAKDREVTFKTVEELAQIFQTSRTASAIRLIQLGSFPAMLVCHGHEGRRWFARSIDLPSSMWPHTELSHETAAFELLFGNARRSHPTPTKANKWISHRNAYKCSVIEDSIKIADNTVLTLIWWKDRNQLAELQ